VRFQVLAEHARCRRDEHEPAVTLFLHHPEGRLGEIEAAVEVHSQHAPPVVGRQLFERDAVEDPRIAHHGVEPSEAFDSGGDDRLTAFGAVDGVMRRNGRSARRDDFVDDGVGD
jgi:hypothetical protein